MPQNIKIDNGKIYVNLGGTILKSTDKGQLWTSVSQNVSCYDVHLGNCYSLISNSDYFKNISFPVFYDVTLGTNNKISNDVITRYVYSWFYNSVDFVDDYFVIATGNNKLITISTDGGRNWNYASNINVEATASQWLNKDTGFVIYKKGQVFKCIMNQHWILVLLMHIISMIQVMALFIIQATFREIVIFLLPNIMITDCDLPEKIV